MPTKRNSIDGEAYLDPYLGQSIDDRANTAQKEGSGFMRFISLAVIVGIIAAVVFFFPGCATYQTPTTEQIDAMAEAFTNSNIYAEIEARVQAYEKSKKQPEVKPDDGATVETPVADAAAVAGDAVDFGALQWSYGGWDGGKARFTGDAVISGLSVNNSGMSYKWKSGGCQNIGAGNGGDYSQTMACLFIKEPDGVWRGGKFDWISTSRKTRDFANIHGGYHGWNAAGFKAAKECAFVIVSKGGYRTNVIRGSK